MSAAGKRLAALRLPEFLLAPALKDLVREPPGGVALVDGERQGRPVTAVSERARKAGLRIGTSAKHARTMIDGLVLVELDWERLEEERRDLEQAVRSICPDFEHDRPGLLFFRIGGVMRHHAGEEALGEALRNAAVGLGHKAAVGIADLRLAAELAARRALREERSLEIVAPGEQVAFMADASVWELPDEKLVDHLVSLGVDTLGDLVRLPPAALGQRFGAEAAHWRALAAGEERQPWSPCREQSEYEVFSATPGPVSNLEGLRFVLRAAVERLCAGLAAEASAMSAVEWTLSTDLGEPMHGTTHAARPSSSARLWSELLLLNFQQLTAPAPIVALRMKALGIEAEDARQMRLLGSREAQPGALDRALARVTAALGESSYGLLVPQPALRPEERSELQPALPLPIAGDSGRKKRGGARRKALPPCWPGTRIPRWLSDKLEDGAIGSTLRLLEQPVPVRVRKRDGRPERFIRDGRRPWIADAWAGPWDISGDWWGTRSTARSYWLVGHQGCWALLRCDGGEVRGSGSDGMQGSREGGGEGEEVDRSEEVSGGGAGVIGMGRDGEWMLEGWVD